MTKKILSIFFMLALATTAFSQAGKDTTFYKDAIKNSLAVYEKFAFEKADLYSGYQYVRPEQTSDDEHPYFESDDWVPGTVEYDGQVFENVPLLYDIRNDKVVTEHYLNASEIEFIPEKLDGFTMAGHRFKKIKNETVGNSLPRSDYYEILYDGATRAIAMRKKNSLRTTSSSQVVVLFEKRTRYFMFKNGRFFPVKSKASVLKLLSDEKKALKQFLSSQKIRFKNNVETSIAKMAEHYDTLKTR